MKHFYLLFTTALLLFGSTLGFSQNYCTPSFTVGCVQNDIINNFSTSGGTKNISNLGSGCGTGAFTFYSNDTLEVVEGGSFSFTVQSSATWAQGFRIYIDWNGDYDFNDSNESPWNSGSWSTSAFTSSITLPIGCLAGVKRIRVVCNYNSIPTNSCGVGSFGEVEDYVLVVTAPNYFNYKPENVQYSQGVYQDLGTLGTAISTANTDDANSAATSIGFNFNFNGTSFSEFVLNTNGFIRLGNSGYSSNQFFANQALSNDNSPFKSSNILAPFNQDLKGDASTEYRVYTTGKVNERVCIIQYKNVKDRVTTRQFESLNFQIKLYEGTNVIEFVYGDFIPSSNTLVYEAFLVGVKANNSANSITIAKGASASFFSATANSGEYASSSIAFFSGNTPLSPQMPYGFRIRFNTGNIVIARPNTTASKTAKTCSTSSSTFNLNVSGGTAPYAIVWSDTNYTFTRELTAANYQYTVTDALGNWIVSNVPNYTIPSISTFPHLTTFQTTAPDWKQSLDDDDDFIFASGVTPTATTGPSSGANSTTNYIYLESDSGASSEFAAYESPCYDFSVVNYPAISFYYQMYGAGCDSLVLEADSGNGAWYKVWGNYGDVGNSWNYKTIKLISLGGKSARLRFVAKHSNTNTGDIAIDEISVFSGPAPDFFAGFGNALSFDGIDDNVRINSSLGNFGTSNFTIEAWVKTSASSQGTIISKRDAPSYGNFFTLEIGSNGKLSLHINESSVANYTEIESSSAINDGSWHHVAAVRNSGQLFLYIDGQQAASPVSIIGNPNISNSVTTYIGQLQFAGAPTPTDRFNGTLDEIRIWSDARTANEIANNYRTQLSGTESNLEAYYNFNSSSGTTLFDISTNNNDGEMYNFTGNVWVASHSPIIWPTVNEVLSLSTTLGYAFGWDEIGSSLAYTIVSGNSANYFQINSSTGEITLNNSLDYETDSIINLGVSVLESGNNTQDTAFYKFVVTDVNEVLFAGMGNALEFDGTNDYVEIADTDSLNVLDGDFTLEAWVNVTSVANSETILSKGNGNGNASSDAFIFSIYNGKIALELGGTSTSEWQFSSTTVPTNQWVHVAAAFDQSSMSVTFYLNGEEDGTQTYSLGTLYNADLNPLYIGKQGYSCDCNYFNGKIDEVKFWSKQRTEEEIDSNMFVRMTGVENNLILYYNFDEVQESELFDFSSPSINGDLKNFTGSYWVANTDTLEFTIEENPLITDTLFKVGYYSNSLNTTLIFIQQSAGSDAYTISNGYVFGAKPKIINYESDSLFYMQYVVLQQGLTPDTAIVKVQITDKVDLIIWNGNGNWYTDSLAGWSTQYTPNVEDSVVVQSGILVLNGDTTEVRIVNVIGGSIQLTNGAVITVNEKTYLLSASEIAISGGSTLLIGGQIFIDGTSRVKIPGNAVFTGNIKF